MSSTLKTKVALGDEIHKCTLSLDFEQARACILKRFGKLLPINWLISYEDKDGKHEVRSNQDYNRMFSLQPKKLEISEELDQTLYTEQGLPTKRNESISLSSEDEDEEKARSVSSIEQENQEDSSSETQSEEEDEEEPRSREKPFLDAARVNKKPVLESAAIQFQNYSPMQPESIQSKINKEKEKKKRKRNEPEIENVNPNLFLQMNPNLAGQMQGFLGSGKNFYADKNKAKETRKAALRDVANENLESQHVLFQMMKEFMMQNRVQNEMLQAKIGNLEKNLKKTKKDLKSLIEMKDSISQSNQKIEKKVEELGGTLEGLTKELKEVLTQVKSTNPAGKEDMKSDQPKKGNKEAGKKNGKKTGKKPRSPSESEEEELESESESSSESNSDFSQKRKVQGRNGKKNPDFFSSSFRANDSDFAFAQNQRIDPTLSRMGRGQWPNQGERADRSVERNNQMTGRQGNFGYPPPMQYQNFATQPSQQNFAASLSYPYQQQQQQQQHQLYPSLQNDPNLKDFQDLQNKCQKLYQLFPKVDREAISNFVMDNPKMSIEAIIEQNGLGQ